ncbi:hypothetical protein [Nocardioides sp.]|uniref:hypothetical protein n=1 Tax=Nocardioides sp. TaxID=35761 RepID=UPI00356845FC
MFLGRVVRPGVDPEWLQSDRDDALAWQVHENRRCKSCGTHPEEWAEDKLAFHAHLDECKGCKQRERLAQSDGAKKAGEGVSAVMAHGSAADCLRCKPIPMG